MTRTASWMALLMAAGMSPLFIAPVRSGTPLGLRSPNGSIVVRVTLPPASRFALPVWSLSFGGKQRFADCQLGLNTREAGYLLAEAKLVSQHLTSVDRKIPVLFGKASQARDRYNQLRLEMEGRDRRRLEVTFRCYDNAVAVHYSVPQQSGLIKLTVLDEWTSFAPSGSPTAYVQYLENYRTSHEHRVTSLPWHQVKPDRPVDLPTTLSWPDGTYAAITEAALSKYSGMSLRMRNTEHYTDLVSDLTPRDDGTKVVRPLPMTTPWRVILIGDRPGKLLESNTLYCLNEPSKIGDTSWIKPGKITFSWWNGDVYDGKRGAPILSLEMQKKYIDWCARNGIPTHSVIADETVTPWYHQSNPGVVPGPDTDVTRVRDDLDLAAIRKYAKSKGIRLWTWVHQGALRGRVEEAFAAFEKMGWSGMMVDFFDHDDQDTVEFAEQILQAAARHHILIHFHGVWKSTGMQRTYPNLMNHEGALNLEYLKWSDRCTPEHNLMMAFTRMIAGPMDYHLGGFRAVTRAEFKPQNITPVVLGTRCHMLAMYVCFDNPNPMVADYPMAYEGQPGFDFLRDVPTYWDETRVLIGEVGKTLVTARRKGRIWYVGGMHAGPPCDVDVPLAYLKGRPCTAELWSDAVESETDPNRLATKKRDLAGSGTIRIHFATDGGFVMRLTERRKTR